MKTTLAVLLAAVVVAGCGDGEPATTTTLIPTTTTSVVDAEVAYCLGFTHGREVGEYTVFKLVDRTPIDTPDFELWSKEKYDREYDSCFTGRPFDVPESAWWFTDEQVTQIEQQRSGPAGGPPPVQK